jgi:hypothetical protein
MRNEHDNGQCSNATLKGSYGLHATGTVIGVGYALLFGGASQRRTVTLLRERGAVE